ncbi:dUTP diphosphatase [Peribacillus frigoritolerans]|uniref:dUTP diphosphatase n=1 Tax=Peribacillus frigoritolerans TaxID=450367 RepID=UPI003D06A74B
MNLSKLFEAQKELGKVGLFNYQGEDRFNKLVLALLVELGECANEWRGFKFWSTDQEPRTNVVEHIYSNESGYNTVRKNKLLEEYVDGLHFVLEIGLELNYTNFDLWTVKKDTTNQFIDCFHWINNLHFQKYVTGKVPIGIYEFVWSNYIGLGEMLGFTWEQIEAAYFEKHAINLKRQENGY